MGYSKQFPAQQFLRIFKIGGSELWPLIWNPTAHGHLLQPDGAKSRERERGPGEAPAGGEGLRGGLGVREGSRGYSGVAVASPETHHGGVTARWPSSSVSPMGESVLGLATGEI